jgi:hypothetical protein
MTDSILLMNLTEAVVMVSLGREVITFLIFHISKVEVEKEQGGSGTERRTMRNTWKRKRRRKPNVKKRTGKHL